MANETVIREGLIVKGPTIISGSLYLTGEIYNGQLSAIQSFTQSYYTDSASFDLRIRQTIDTGSYIQRPEFNLYTQSVSNDSASFDNRIYSASLASNIITVTNPLPYQRLSYDSGSAKFINQYKQRDLICINYSMSPYTITVPSADVMVDSLNGPVEIRMMSASAAINGADINLYKISQDANDVTILPYTGQNINGDTQKVIYKYNEGFTFIADDNGWNILIKKTSNIQTLTVKGTNGTDGDFNTLKDALDFVNSSSFAPTMIRLYSGIHQINEPILIDSAYDITILGDGVTSTILQTSASLIGQPLFNINSPTSINRLTIDCIDGYGDDPNEIIFNYTNNPISPFYSEIKDVILLDPATALNCYTDNELWIFDTDFSGCKYYAINVGSSSYVAISETNLTLRDNGIAINAIDDSVFEIWNSAIYNMQDTTLGTASYQTGNSNIKLYPGCTIYDIGNGTIQYGNSILTSRGIGYSNIANNYFEAYETTEIDVINCSGDSLITHYVDTSSVTYHLQSYDNSQESFIIETSDNKNNKIFTQVRHELPTDQLPSIGFSKDILLGLNNFYSFDYTLYTEGSASITSRAYNGNTYFNALTHKANSRAMCNFIYAPSTSSLAGYWIWSNGQNENKDYVIQNHNRVPVFTIHSGSWQIEFGLSGSSYTFPTTSGLPNQALILGNSNDLTWGDSAYFKSASVPLSVTASGTEGSIAYSSDHLYICIAPNTWRRTILTTF